MELAAQRGMIWEGGVCDEVAEFFSGWCSMRCFACAAARLHPPDNSVIRGVLTRRLEGGKCMGTAEKLFNGWDVVFWFMLVIIVILIPVCIYSFRREHQRTKADIEKSRELILKTKILDMIHETTSSTHNSTGSAVGRAVVGGAVAGPLGAAVGASTAKSNTHSTEKWTKTTFLVVYKDGSHTTKTVSNGSAWYKLYMEKLEIE